MKIFLKIIKILILILIIFPTALIAAIEISFTYDAWWVVEKVSPEGIELIQKYYPPLLELPKDALYKEIRCTAPIPPASDTVISITVTMPVSSYGKVRSKFPQHIDLENGGLTIWYSKISEDYIKLKINTRSPLGHLSEIENYCKTHNYLKHYLIWLAYWIILLLSITILFFPYKKAINRKR